MLSVYGLLRIHQRLPGHRLALVGVLLARRLGVRHLSVRLDPAARCNLACRVCPSVALQSRADRPAAFTRPELERLAAMLFPRALQVVIGCSFEPTVYGGFLDLVSLARAWRVPWVGLTTNGQLLRAEHLRELAVRGLGELTLSTHGVRPATYERLMAGASHTRLHELLRAIRDQRASGQVARFRLRLNYTVNRENLAELAELLDAYGGYGIDVLQIRPVFGGPAPELHLQAADLPQYQALLAQLARGCRERRILLLANRRDPLHVAAAPAIAVLPAVYLYVDPHCVWREDFAWRTESYDQYCRRIGLDRRLWRDLFRSRDALVQAAGRYADSLKYDVG